MQNVPQPHSRAGRFRSFVDASAHKVNELGIDQDTVIPRLSLVARKLNQLMTDDAERRVHRPAGWTQASFRICFALWVLGPLPSHRIAAVTSIGRATISAALKKIHEDGLVTKEPSIEDQRSVVMRLTPQGETATRRTYEAHLEVEREWFGSLTDVEQTLLLMLMQKVMDHSPETP
ncbi:MarR family winged helix-turn-helix transcriptional regulator [Okibacterium endophyticum]